MGQVRLQLMTTVRDGFIDAGGKHIGVEFTEVLALIRIHRRGGGHRLWDCKIDTGAHLSYFPFGIWNEFSESVELLRERNGKGEIVTAEHHPKGVGSTSIACYLGRVSVSLIGGVHSAVGPFDIVGYFQKNRVATGGRILLGLGGNGFGGNTAIISPQKSLAYLEA